MSSLGPPSEPRSRAELLERASGLAGLTLGEIAVELGVALPEDLRRYKGACGQLLEQALGSRAASRAGPDFPELGVEVKTLPVDSRGKILESTFVCTIALNQVGDLEWEQSPVKKKLDCVLWLPVEGVRSIALGARRVGQALLWSPSPEQEADLRFDWEELSGLIGRGRLDEITGHLGRFLQVRPKAANGSVRRRAFREGSGQVAELPRGFYLRAAFTARIVREHYALSG
jgi:DNA mismatch repair protein MutH